MSTPRGPARRNTRPLPSAQRPQAEASITVTCIICGTLIVLLFLTVFGIIYCLKGLTALEELLQFSIKSSAYIKDAFVYMVGNGVLFGVIGGKLLEYLVSLWAKINAGAQQSGLNTP